jgi:hypothetical protein
MDSNKRVFYDRSGAPWDDEEDAILKREYNNEEHDIMQIGISHRRTPGGIGYRLKILGCIASHQDARGYFEYVKSPLYRDIVSRSDETKKERKEKQQKIKVKEPSLDIMDIYNELASIKRDISLLHESLDELKQMVLFSRKVEIQHRKKEPTKPLPPHKQKINYIE